MAQDELSVVKSGATLLEDSSERILLAQGYLIGPNDSMLPGTVVGGTGDRILDDVLLSVVNWGLGLIGFFAVGAFLFGGIMYLLSAGDEKQITNAKNIIKWAIVGMIVALLGYVILFLITGLLDGTGVGQ